MVVSPLVKDAMQRAGEKMPDDGVLVMSSGNAISCAVDDIRSALDRMPSTDANNLRNAYYKAAEGLSTLNDLKSYLPASEKSAVTAAYQALNKSKLGKYV